MPANPVLWNSMNAGSRRHVESTGINNAYDAGLIHGVLSQWMNWARKLSFARRPERQWQALSGRPD